MYRIKGSHAYSHGVYIRPGEYVDMWRTVAHLAHRAEVSISEFVSHNMYLLIEGGVAPNSRLNTNNRIRNPRKKNRKRTHVR